MPLARRASALLSCACLAAFIVALAAQCHTAYAGADYYGILGVPRSATESEIKKAYRKLTAKYHPDRNEGNKEAEAKYMDVNKAYEALSDPEKRRIYDQHGEEGLKTQGAGGNANDVFSQFGFTFNFGGQQENQGPPRGADVVMTLPVTLSDLYTGKETMIIRHTNGKREGRGTRKCNCRQKMSTRQQGYFIQQFLETVCDECPNIEFYPTSREIIVEVEKGMRDGQEIVFAGDADPVIDGEPGNLVLRISTLPHAVFRRDGDNLHMHKAISLVESLVGFEFNIEHLDGHIVKFTRSEVTRPGQVITVPGEGMPRTNNAFYRGDLHITFSIDFPAALTDEQRKGIISLLGPK